MENTKLLAILNNIIQADIDAHYVTHKGIENVENDDNIQYLSQLEKNHDQRVTRLSSIARQLGGTPPVAQDLKGYILEGAVALSGLITQKRVLECIQLCEQKIASLYQELQEILNNDTFIDLEIKALLNEYLGDQHRYLESMKKLLEAA